MPAVTGTEIEVFHLNLHLSAEEKLQKTQSGNSSSLHFHPGMKTATTTLAPAHHLLLAPEREASSSSRSVPFAGADLKAVIVPKILCQHHRKPGEELYVVPAPEYKASLGSYMTGWKRATQPI